PPGPAPAAAPTPTGRPQIAIDTASTLGSLVATTPDQRVTKTTAKVSTLSAAETSALLARLEPLPDLSAGNATAPTLRPASLPPPRAGAVQPIAFVVPTGKPVSDAPIAPGATPTKPLTAPMILPVGEIGAEAAIRIRFDEPMVPVAGVGTQAALPIAISPAIKGTWKWIDTRVAAFVSSEARFPQATEVTITVPAGIKALSGATLAAPATGSFSTPPVTIRNVWPQDLRPDSPLLIAFDQKVDPSQILKFLRVIGPKKEALASRPMGLEEARTLWQKNPSLKTIEQSVQGFGPNFVIIAPQTAWPAGITAQAVLAKAAPSAEGKRVTARESFGTFRVVPAFKALGVTCGRRERPSLTASICPALGWMSVDFSSSIEVSTYRAAKLQITGQRFQDNAPRGASVSFETPKWPGQSHTIPIGEGIVDIYGQPMVGARSLAFTTTLQRFDPQISVRSGFYILDPRFEIPQWVIETEAVSQVRVQLYKVQPTDYFAYAALEGDARKPAPGKLMLDKTYPVGARMGADLRVDLRPLLSASGTGHIVAIATVTPSIPVDEWFNRRNVAWIQVSRLGISARFDGEKVSAWSSSISPDHFLEPVGNLTTELVQNGRPNGTVTATADAGGHVELALPPRVVAKKKKASDASGAILVMKNATDSVFTFMYATERAIRTENALWYVTDDRFTYKPGEPLYMKGWVRWTHDGINPDLSLPKSGEQVAYSLSDSRGNKLASGTAELSDQGGFDFEIKLPPTANLGMARLSISTRDQAITHPISIQEFRTPAYSVNLDDDVGYSGAIPLVIGESIEMNAIAKYFAGGGLPGAEIRWDARLTTIKFQPAGWDLFHFNPIRKRSDRTYWYRSDDPDPVLLHQDGALTGNSASTMVYGIAAVPAGRPSVLEVDTTVTDIDRTNIRASSRPILVHPSAYYVGLRGKPDTVGELEVIVSDLDGNAVKGVPIKIELEGVLGSELHRDDAAVLDTQSCDLVSETVPVVCHWKRKDIKTAYTAVARIADARGRTNVSQYDVPWFTWDDRLDLSILPDRPSYKPGDVAKL
ncbi:MAG: Ig-like domain-containing protein, partial [Polyangiales bacterium]